MNAAWQRFLVIPLLVVAGLLVGSQAAFLSASFYRDLHYGLQAETWSLANYAKMLGDPFYWGVLGTSVGLSAAASAWTVGLGFPTAYVLARSRSGVGDGDDRCRAAVGVHHHRDQDLRADDHFCGGWGAEPGADGTGADIGAGDGDRDAVGGGGRAELFQLRVRGDAAVQRGADDPAEFGGGGFGAWGGAGAGILAGGAAAGGAGGWRRRF